MTTRTMRNILFRIHAWVGPNLSILLLLLFATGTFLVFVTEIEGAQNATVQLGDVLSSVTALRADETSNVVILTLPDLGEDGTVLTWRLGRPLL